MRGQIQRTVSRTPEVMVKVTSGKGSSTSRGVAAHFDYIGRGGDLEIETDDGERLVGDDVGQQLIRAPKSDSVFRAAQRGESIHIAALGEAMVGG